MKKLGIIAGIIVVIMIILMLFIYILPVIRPFYPVRTTEAAVTPEPIPPSVGTLKIAVTGDLMMHREQAAAAHISSTGGYDFNYAFVAVKHYLSNADFTIGNLETTLAGKDIGYSYYPTFNAPDEYAYAIKNAGYDFLTTANNHSNDKMEKGILRTLDVLDNLGIDHTGTFRSAQERESIYVNEINGVSFAILSYTYGTNGIPLASGKPYLVNLLDDGRYLGDIARAKAMNPDVIIVLPHMGEEYATDTNDEYRDIARAMLEAGADVVLASHPHVLQPAEFVTITDADGVERECFVAYSLGNFFSSQRPEPRDIGAVFNLYFEKKDGRTRLLNIGYIPTWVKFADALGTRDISIHAVYDALNNPGEISADDIDRLKRAHEETCRMFLGKPVPIEDMQLEYYLR